MTGIGPVAVRQPRVRDREAGATDPDRIRFSPSISSECEAFVRLPPYMRRSKSIETLLPILHRGGSRPATSPRRWRRCWARTLPGCRHPPGPGHCRRVRFSQRPLRRADLVEGRIARILCREQGGIESIAARRAKLERVRADTTRGAIDNAAGPERERVARAQEADRSSARAGDGAGIQKMPLAELALMPIPPKIVPEFVTLALLVEMPVPIAAIIPELITWRWRWR